MRVLIVHDAYEEAQPCGENAMVRWEAASLAEAGVAVRVVETSQAVHGEPLWKRTLVNGLGLYSVGERGRVEGELAAFRPDVVHIHNVFPHMTPAVYLACRAAGVPVVQTLHNYRMLCPAGFLHREERPCALCLEKRLAWPAVVHRCVQGKVLNSVLKMNAAAAQKMVVLREGMVDVFISTSEAMRARYVQGGFPEERMVVKPSGSPDPKVGEREREYFCFAGRLSEEKGIGLMLEAWGKAGMPALRIAGAGPMEGAVREAAERNPAVRYVGMLRPEEVFGLMAGAKATLVPSTWDEPSPVVMMQSFSVGTPVISSDLGRRGEIVGDGGCGVVFLSGSAAGLEAAVRRVEGAEQERREMGRAARRVYEEQYSLEAGARVLMGIYARVAGGVSGE